MGLLLHTVVVLVVAVALLCCLLRDTNHVHHLTHGARTALKHGCVADAGWAKVLRLYCEKTDLSSLHTWCAVLVGLLVVKLVVALVMAV